MRSSWIASRILERATPKSLDTSAVDRFIQKLSLGARSLCLSLGWDAPCYVRVEGLPDPLWLPLSHQLPMYRARHAHYDRLIDEVATFIRSTQPLRMIDVGANVGDSILAASAAESDAFLAFEPHPAFIRYLRANLRNLENVIFSDVACGADEGSVVLPQAARGTAGTVVAGNAAAAQVSLASLDASVPLLWKGLTPNFVKIDTDGFDIDVIEGGGVLLRDTRPWLLYEADPRLTATGIERHIDGLALLNDAGYRCAAAFTNLGHFSMRLATADAPSWRKLFETHSAKGPVYYHDVLLAPSEAELTHFLVQLGAKRWPGVEA